MKTLDDVIKTLELCSMDDDPCDKCPYTEFDKNGEWACSMCGDFAQDALHYLKEYRKKKAELEFLKREIKSTNEYMQAKIKAEEDAEWRKAYDKVFHPNFDNPPLTWDELQQMEGKPVWMESHGNITEFTGWVIVRNVLEDRAYFILSHYDGEFLTYEMAFPDVTFGTTWYVYRKERMNETN